MSPSWPDLVLAALLLCPGLALQEEERPLPTAEEVKRIGNALDEAYRSKDAQRIEEALDATHTTPHRTIVRLVTRGLEDERMEVQLAALRALRWNEHEEALDALHLAAKNRKLTGTPQVAAAVFRGIGQHGAPESVSVLARNPFEPDDHSCRRARIFGLARIRTPEALDALMGILAVSEFGPRAPERRIIGQMEDVRIALIWITGIDLGLSPDQWEGWWRENKKGYRLPPEPPSLPDKMRIQWNGFWGLPRVYERDRRREDRGQ